MNNNILKAFAKNGLQILQWSILVLLYETEGQRLKLEEIRECLDLPTSNNSQPEGTTRNAFVREILRSSQDKYKHVKYIGRKTWQLTDKGREFVETGKKRYTQIN